MQVVDEKPNSSLIRKFLLLYSHNPDTVPCFIGHLNFNQVTWNIIHHCFVVQVFPLVGCHQTKSMGTHPSIQDVRNDHSRALPLNYTVKLRLWPLQITLTSTHYTCYHGFTTPYHKQSWFRPLLVNSRCFLFYSRMILLFHYW